MRNGVSGVFLSRLTITGFKSFADKTVLSLEPGITAVVGPNGSGKSNLADAVRWAMGEQSRGRLRLNDREEIIFAGTSKRAKASYAEVVLLFNNEDGAIPLDLTEVEISRRLYRSGETEYRLAGRVVRLADIQELLARSGIGASTYSVIGQGMIDSFLLSSPEQRKALFDDAAGIRGPELSREAAMRKLTATTANLVRLRDIVAELAPRLHGLEQAVARSGEQAKLERRILELRRTVVAAGLARLERLATDAQAGQERAEAELQRLAGEQTGLERRLADASAAADRAAGERRALETALTQLEHTRDALSLQLGEQRASAADATRASDRLAVVTRRLSAARRELKSARHRHAALLAERHSNATAAQRATAAVEQTAAKVVAAQAALIAIRQDTAGSGRDQYISHALEIVRLMATNLAGPEPSFEHIKLLVHKAGRLLKAATTTDAGELLAALSAAQQRLEQAMAARETAVEHQTNVTITTRSLEIDLAHQQEAVNRAEAEVTALEAEATPLQVAATRRRELQAATAATERQLADTAAKLEQQREQVRSAVSATAPPELIELAASLERTQAAAAAARQSIERCQSTATATAAAIQSLHRRAEAWDLNPAAIIPATTDANPADLEAELARAEATLEARAAAARDQATEYEAVGQRHAELASQIADLERAQADLEHIVTELNTVVRERFKANFAALSEQFSASFARLFDGGSSALTLTEAADAGYGIDIKASPKGKRAGSLQALSGGERALAGVALLAAILHVNPSPFVVLDEIDAALDEANSGRLAAILADLGTQSQLIVITHNRQTMQAARVLFGITTSDHHASKLLSLRLEDAAALAAR